LEVYPNHDKGNALENRTMEPLVTFTSIAVPIDETNVNTDQIIPAEFLPKPRSEGFARFLFHRRRFGVDGREDPAFVLNHAPFRAARILVADANFGCGSSRESAVWARAIDAFGISCAMPSLIVQ
jgi:3-isopropylmalate/(R)-2-methylmalate dehydratase small subunit